MVMQRTLAKLGNKTRYGHIVSASSTIFDEDHNPLVRAGDKAWCDVCKGAFEINATYTGFLEAGFIAGDGDLVLCHCKDNFVIAISGFTGERHPGIMSAKPAAFAIAPEKQQREEPEQHAQTAKKKRTGVDAGFCVVPEQSTTKSYESILFAGSQPEGTRELYRSLNGASKEYKAGSILLVVDPDKQDDEQIAHMQKAKARVDAALEPLTHNEANFLHKHYATIANFSNIADKGIGLAADPVGKYFENIEKILNEIQETYKNAYMTRGALIGEQFYVRRAQLFNELDRVLKVGFLNKAMKFGEYTKIKNALGLSSSSITHKWNETGVSDIEGYATHIERAAKYVKAMRYAGYVGIAFSAVHSVNEINEACSTGRETECTKKKFTEIGSFSGGLAGGYAGGALGMGLCTLILGGVTIEVGGAGALACGVVLGTGGGYLLGEGGAELGQSFGESIYEAVGK
ncbi:PAAR domain-containing protein [Enterobacteriaceae bacterium H11S18]|uniref:PAAR domain-containing protein n=1 Tax=Dryocola clanedunensis TaxID=2925396 RepID=UPI0022F0440A|nr:PAAR domain-containing protein [Dryocola clanedunensis]MCT4709340.1 PAAR domain-containing protein [Dryocola clanedunensis]